MKIWGDGAKPQHEQQRPAVAVAPRLQDLCDLAGQGLAGASQGRRHAGVDQRVDCLHFRSILAFMNCSSIILPLRCPCFDSFFQISHVIFIHTINKMKSVQQVLLLLVAAVACVSGFAPVTSPRSTTSLAMTNKAPEPVNNMMKDEKKAAARAAAGVPIRMAIDSPLIRCIGLVPA